MNKEDNDKLVPKLRFPEFIPEMWSIEPLKELYSFKATNSFSRDNLNYKVGNVKNIHYGDIHTKFSSLFDIVNEVVPFINPSINIDKINPDSYCIEGDLIFADASEDLHDIGKTIELVSLNNERLLSGMHTLLARQKEPKFAIGFSGQLFTTSEIRTQIQRESQGTKVLGVSPTRLSNIKICFPRNKAEQKKIADCLSSLTQYITAEKQQLEALKVHKKGLMQKLFPGEGEIVPQLRFADFMDSGEWRERGLDRLLQFKNGINAPKELYGKGVKFINVLDILQNEFITYELIIGLVDVSNEMVKSFSVDYGDILFQRSSETQEEVGTTNVYLDKERTATFGGFVIRGKKIGEYEPFFLNKLLKTQTIRNSITSKSGGSTRYNIGQETLSSIKILVPSIIEQQKIGKCLSSLDELITAQTEKIKKLNLHRKGLIQGLFPSSLP